MLRSQVSPTTPTHSDAQIHVALNTATTSVVGLSHFAFPKCLAAIARSLAVLCYKMRRVGLKNLARMWIYFLSLFEWVRREMKLVGLSRRFDNCS